MSSLLRVGRTSEDEQAVDDLVRDIQAMALDLVARLGTLEGEIKTRKETQPKTFADTAKTVSQI